ncbi:MAG: hypothetical protein CM15mV18_0400 [uncultured marine virus]|nr:MAG: hypothetical protein CM15mV18_0400 [uncultured marine virus]
MRSYNETLYKDIDKCNVYHINVRLLQKIDNIKISELNWQSGSMIVH